MRRLCLCNKLNTRSILILHKSGRRYILWWVTGIENNNISSFGEVGEPKDRSGTGEWFRIVSSFSAGECTNEYVYKCRYVVP